MNGTGITYLPPRDLTEFKTQIPSRDELNRANLFLVSLPIYTDGSKMEESTWAGVFCPQLGMIYSFQLGRMPSVFLAKIFAIMKTAAFFIPYTT